MKSPGLFAASGSIEIGLDGVYRGQQRVREYLDAFGGGKTGLAPGQLNEYLQVMPVVTLSADGLSAQRNMARDRARGPARQGRVLGRRPLRERVREGKRRLEDQQRALVSNADGAVRRRLAAACRCEWRALRGPWSQGGRIDAGCAAERAVQIMAGRVRAGVPLQGQAAGGAAHSGAEAERPARRCSTEARGAARTRRAADRRSVADRDPAADLRLYLDKGLWSQAADLFASDGEIEVEGRGAQVGKEHVLRYLRAIGPEGPVEGRLYDHMQLAPVVHVSSDGKTAKARWALFAQLARQKDFHEWGTGVYENEYVKDGGVWKIRRLHLYPTMYTPYDAGWGKSVQPYSSFEPELAPDRKPGKKRAAGPAPYHFANPVTARASHSTALAAGRRAERC